jgi:hypothetical protein
MAGKPCHSWRMADLWALSDRCVLNVSCSGVWRLGKGKVELETWPNEVLYLYSAPCCS